MKHVLAVLLLFTAGNLFAQNGWYSITPFPASDPIFAAACLDSLVCVVAGPEGTMMRTTDGGVTWQQLRTSLATILGMTFLDRTTGFAFGEGGIILKTTDAGVHWIGTIAPPSPMFLDGSMSDENTACIVGVYGTILHSSDGGASWQAKRSGTSYDLLCVASLSPSTAIAAGQNGTMLRTDDSAKTWKPIVAISAGGTINRLFFRDSIHGIASTDYANYETSDGGVHWTYILSGPLYRTRIAFMKYFTPDSGMFCAGSINRMDIYTTTDTGAHWSSSSGLSSNIFSFANFKYGFAILTASSGSDGLSIIRYTTNGGVTWKTRSSAFGQNPFSCVAFAKRSPVGLTFSDGYGAIPPQFYLTTDAGATWAPQTSPVDGIVNVAMPDPLHATGVSSSGRIVHTSDGGAHWIEQTSGTTEPLYGVAFGDSVNGFAVGGYADTLGPNYRVVLRTTDGGTTWTKNYDGTGYYLTAIAMLDKNQVMAVGANGTITKTTDGGLHWSELELIDHPLLTAISYPDSSHITAIGNPWYITHSRDAGLNWVRQPIKGKSGYIDLTAVCFPDSANGTIVGMIGKILHTTNGGDSWNQQWSGVQSRFHGVAFTDVNTGVIVGGHGEAWGEMANGEAPIIILRTTNANKPPVFSKNKQSIAFGNVKLGKTKFDSVIVFNRGQGEMIFKLVIPTNLVFNVNPSSTIIEPGDSMVFYVTFSPRNVLMQTGAIQFYWLGDASPDSVVVSGWGSGGPALEWNREILFGDVRIGTSKLDSVTIYNRGDTLLNIQSIVSEDALFSPEISSALIRPGDSLALRVSFSPPVDLIWDSSGRVSSLMFVHNGVTSPDTIGIHGVGVWTTVTNKNIDFGNVALHTTKVDSFGVFDDIAYLLFIDSINSTNPMFTTTPHSMSLGIGDTHTVKVSFLPRAIGPDTGYIIVFHNDHSRPDTVTVTGNGIGPVLTVSKRLLDFGKVLSGKTKIDSFQVANIGALPLNISDITTGVLVFASNPDSLLLQPGGTAWIHVIYRPTTVVHSSGFVYLTNNGAVNPDSVALVGELQLSGVDDRSLAPLSSHLLLNYPNPATTSTVFQFVLPDAQHVSLRLYTLLGAEVATLLNQRCGEGTTSVLFNTRNLQSGVYHAVLQYNSMRLDRTVVIKN